MSDLGYIYLSIAGLDNLALIHLISAVDEDESPTASDAAVRTSITGYTEWINEGGEITIGWDWQMLASNSTSKLVRISLPSSNVMLRSDSAQDIGYQATAQVLGGFIDEFPWQEETLRYIGIRHAAESASRISQT